MRMTKVSIAATLATIMALSTVGFGAAQAASIQSTSKPAVSTDASTTLDFSARKKRRTHRNNAAAAAAAIGLFGTIAGLAARDSYDDDYYYGGRGYYGGGYGYAPRYRGHYRGARRHYRGSGHYRSGGTLPGNASPFAR